jgi:calcineurin-like phosphoesterase family protein
MRYLYRLNGKIIVIIGNHDTDARIRIYEIVHNIIDVKYADRIKIDKYNFWLSHYPTNTINFDYDANKPLSYLVLNLHGHTHQTTNFINDNYTQYHVGVDSHNNTPVAAEDIIKEIKECRDRANINKIIT